MRVLLIEDDELLGNGLATGLRQYDYVVDLLTDGLAAERALKSETFDAVILDIGLPHKSGLEILESLRQRGNNTPVLILTARETVEDRIRGLDSGADDYLVKPFDLEELCARLRALQRRKSARAAVVIKHGEIELDPAAHTVKLNGEPVVLSRREFGLLHRLLENTGRVLSREYLTQSLYGWEDDVDSNALEVHVHNLRKKFGSDFIRTIRGVGYLIKKDTE